MIAVQVGEQHRGQPDREQPGCREAHEHTAAAVDEEVGATGLDQCRRTSAPRVGQRAARAEEGDDRAAHRRPPDPGAPEDDAGPTSEPNSRVNPSAIAAIARGRLITWSPRRSW